MSKESLQAEIKSLEVFLGEKDGNHEAVICTIKTLNGMLEMLQNQDLDAETIRNHVLSDNDPLEGINGLSGSFCVSASEIQHAIIKHFS